MPKEKKQPPPASVRATEIMSSYPQAQKDEKLQEYYKNMLNVEEKLLNIIDPREISDLQRHEEQLLRQMELRQEKKAAIWEYRKTRQEKIEEQKNAISSSEPSYVQGPTESTNKKGDNVVVFTIYAIPDLITKALRPYLEQGYQLFDKMHNQALNTVMYTLLKKEDKK